MRVITQGLGMRQALLTMGLATFAVSTMLPLVTITVSLTLDGYGRVGTGRS